MTKPCQQLKSIVSHIQEPAPLLLGLEESLSAKRPNEALQLGLAL